MIFNKLYSQEFQSTLLREERLARTFPAFLLPTISIHAPARGATALKAEYGEEGGNFNPRSCERSDSNNEQIINLFLHIIINIYKFITIPMLISILTCYIFIFLLIIYGANLL